MNPIDDDRGARMQVTLRLERELLNEMDAIAQREGIDRTEVVRRLLADGLAHRRAESAIADYGAGRSSIWAAASQAGIDLYEMLDRVAEAGVPYQIDPAALDRLRGGGAVAGITRVARFDAGDGRRASRPVVQGRARRPPPPRVRSPSSWLDIVRQRVACCS